MDEEDITKYKFYAGVIGDLKGLCFFKMNKGCACIIKVREYKGHNNQLLFKRYGKRVFVFSEGNQGKNEPF